MTLRIDHRREEVRLTLPVRAALSPALDWLETKRAWVDDQLTKQPEAVAITPGMEVPLGDARYRLVWCADWPRTPHVDGEELRIGGPVEGLEGRLLRWIKQRALEELSAQSAICAARAGVSVSRVGVGDPTSRWGSCSSSGAIRYSWRLIMAPSFVLKATVAHEVAHRVHMDHSPRFHALVEKISEADPKLARAWLRAHGQTLHAFGQG
jgi:predicted metal-dependent hydrolase